MAFDLFCYCNGVGYLENFLFENFKGLIKLFKSFLDTNNFEDIIKIKNSLHAFFKQTKYAFFKKHV
jgi:hypothetical protein